MGAPQVPGLWISRGLWVPLESEQMPSLKTATTGWPSSPSGFNPAQARAWKSLEGNSASGTLQDTRCWLWPQGPLGPRWSLTSLPPLS